MFQTIKKIFKRDLVVSDLVKEIGDNISNERDMWNIEHSPSYNPEHNNSIDYDYWSFYHKTKKISIHISPSEWGTIHRVIWDTDFISTKDEKRYLNKICNVIIDEKIKEITNEREKAIVERETRYKEYADKKEQYLNSIKSINDFENRFGS